MGDLMATCIDLFCGLGGWAEGFLAEGYFVVGFDIERHDYGTGGYPAQLVLQDVLTLHGSQFKDAAIIVASPPCQAYSYRAMPWKRAKELPPPGQHIVSGVLSDPARGIRSGRQAYPAYRRECQSCSKVGRSCQVALWEFLSMGRRAGADAANEQSANEIPILLQPQALEGS